MLALFFRIKKKIYLGFWSHLLSEKSFKFAFQINTSNFPPPSFTAYKIYTAYILEGVEKGVALQWPDRLFAWQEATNLYLGTSAKEGISFHIM